MIATDRLEAIGWRPGHTNEETLLETHDALGADAIPTAKIAVAAAGAVAWARWRATRSGAGARIRR